MTFFLTKIKQLKTFICTHRLPRKQAALQNLLLTVIVVLIGMFGLRAYAEAYTVEQAVDQWCQQHYFGEGEIYAKINFDYDEMPHCFVYFGRPAEDGERSACLYVRQVNRWKWEPFGWHYVSEPRKIHTGEMEQYLSSFPEFDGFWNYSCMKDQTQNQGNQLWMSVSHAPWYENYTEMPEEEVQTAVEFTVNLDTGTVTESSFPTYRAQIYGDSNLEEIQFWLSEERMVHIAEITAAALNQKDEK